MSLLEVLGLAIWSGAVAGLAWAFAGKEPVGVWMFLIGLGMALMGAGMLIYG